MIEEEEVPPSRANTNRMIRVLAGTGHQRFTVTVHHADGSKDEFQTDHAPKVSWNNDTRSIWLGVEDYPLSHPIMPWKEGDILHVEQNPDWVEKKK